MSKRGEFWLCEQPHATAVQMLSEGSYRQGCSKAQYEIILHCLLSVDDSPCFLVSVPG